MQAVRVNPGNPVANHALGKILNDLRRPADALDCFARAIEKKPDFPEAHNDLGIALRALNRPADALRSYARAIGLRPAFFQAWINRGNALDDLRQFADALASYEQALKLQPDVPEAWVARGKVLADLQRLPEALVSFSRAAALKPDFPFLAGMRLQARLQLADWSGVEDDIAALAARLERGEAAAPPFPVLAAIGSPRLQQQAARTWVNAKCPPSDALGPLPLPMPSPRIRLGYYSADFHEHATTSLMAELFELHDRSRFELIAFSFGPDSSDAMRARTKAAFDRFIDVRTASDLQVAKTSRELQIDIAVDLKGFTEGSRPGIFAARAAPIQVSYLGYPGTMGAPYIDYLIADRCLITAASRPHYSERIIYLPHSYQVNDRQRGYADRPSSRAEYGLPGQGTVFCCFNNGYKISPRTFDVWMRILSQVEGSVLWLLQDNEVAAGNLRREAERRGVAGQRLVFAPRVAREEHLGRQRLADLFLDTLPYNAHTSASDALWVGLPVLTRTGAAFAGRVATSLLTAMALPELIAQTEAAYEASAIALATQPGELARIHRHLRDVRMSAPLFDTPLFVRSLEAAYSAIHQRHLAQLEPADLELG